MDEKIEQENKRTFTDRRKKPTSFLSKYTFFGRRRVSRRITDPQKNYYVDKIGGKYFAAIVAIFVLSVIDSIFTLYHVNRGFQEINPLLNAFLFNNIYFLIIKYALTIVGIGALVLHKYFVFVNELVIFLITLYISLDIYQLYLFIKY